MCLRVSGAVAPSAPARSRSLPQQCELEVQSSSKSMHDIGIAFRLNCHPRSALRVHHRSERHRQGAIAPLSFSRVEARNTSRIFADIAADPRAPSLPSSRFTMLTPQHLQAPIRIRQATWLSVKRLHAGRPYGEKHRRRGVKRARPPNLSAGRQRSAQRPNRPLGNAGSRRPRLRANRRLPERPREKRRSRRGHRALPRLAGLRLRRRNPARCSTSTGS